MNKNPEQFWFDLMQEYKAQNEILESALELLCNDISHGKHNSKLTKYLYIDRVKQLRRS